MFIATEMLAESRSAFSAGFAVATAVNALMRPTIVPSKPEQRRDVGERREIVRALLEPRHDLHEALLHGLLDVLAPPRGAHAVQAVRHDLADGGAATCS